MRARLGVVGAALLGATFLIGGASTSAGAATAGCSLSVTTNCVMGTVVITTFVNGSGPALPSAGWKNTISSTNCTFPNTPIVMTPAAGGTVSSAPLLVNDPGGSPCLYMVSEEPITGWLTAYNPSVPVAMAFTTSSSFEADLAVTNTPRPPAPVGTVSVPVTVTVPASSPAPSPTSPPAPAAGAAAVAVPATADGGTAPAGGFPLQAASGR